MVNTPVIWPADHVERRPTASLVPYARNARTHTDAQIAQVAASIREFGWTIPVLIDEDGTIIAGHCRVLAAHVLAIHDLPVMTARGWSDAKRRAYVIVDNQLALNAGWDHEVLAVEIDELRDLNFDLTLLGFDPGTLNDLIGTPNDAPDPDADARADEIPPPSDVTVTRPGDVWILGSHRVMCGDCRSAADVLRLIDGAPINIAFTSPPYAEQREYDETSGFRPIPPDQYVTWFEPVAANVAKVIAPDASWFVNIKPCSDGLDTSLYVFDLVIAHARVWGWHFATEFCWERSGVPKSVTQRFKNQFEPVYQFAKGRWKLRPDAVRHPSENVPRAAGEGVGNTSWSTEQGSRDIFGAARRRHQETDAQIEFKGPGLAFPGNRLPTFSGTHQALGHAAAFPVGLPEWFIKAFTDENDTVFDPFVGSGSTIIAAERTHRIGYGMDLSPTYCDIAVRRWQDYTGQSATLKETGERYGSLANRNGHAPTS